MGDARRGPFTLVTVNTAPDRAKRLVGQMIAKLEDRYDITHVDNCSSIEEVASKVQQHQPNILVSGESTRELWVQNLTCTSSRHRCGHQRRHRRFGKSQSESDLVSVFTIPPPVRVPVSYLFHRNQNACYTTGLAGGTRAGCDSGISSRECSSVVGFYYTIILNGIYACG